MDIIKLINFIKLLSQLDITILCSKFSFRLFKQLIGQPRFLEYTTKISDKEKSILRSSINNLNIIKKFSKKLRLLRQEMIFKFGIFSQHNILTLKFPYHVFYDISNTKNPLRITHLYDFDIIIEPKFKKNQSLLMQKYALYT